MKNGTRKGITLAAAILAVLLVTHTAWNIYAGHALRRTLRLQALAGHPAALKDLIPEAPSPRTDASEPLKRAFALMEQGRDGQGGRYGLVAQLLSYHDGSKPTANPAASLPALDASHRKGVWQAVDSDAMRPVYQLIEDASHRPVCRFEPDLSLGVAAVPRDVIQLRNAIQLLVLRSWLHGDSGRFGPAMSDLAAATRLCAFLEGYPLLVPQLQRASAGGIVLARLAELLKSAPPSGFTPAELDELDMALALLRDPDHVGLARAVDGERIVFGNWLAQGLLHGQALSAIGATVPRWLRWYVSFPARPLLKSDICTYLTVMADGREYVRLPYAEQRKRPDPTTTVQRWHPLARALAPSLGRVSERLALLETGVQQARAAVVLARFRREHKRYPQTWTETNAAEMPDPMGGKLSYHMLDSGYLLVSAGPNGRDESGEGDDWVWPPRR